MPRDKDFSRDRLCSLFPDIYEALTGGSRDYYQEYGAHAHVHRPNTKADIIRDHAVDRLRASWIENPNVKFRDENNTTYISLFDEYEALVKKSDDAGGIEFSKTQLSFEFQCNQGRLAFDSEVTNICFSYVPNPNNPREPSVVIVCPGLKRPFWMLDIEPPASVAISEITPELPPTPPEGELGDLVRVPTEKKADDLEPE